MKNYVEKIITYKMYGMNNLQMGRKSKIPVSTRMRTKVFNELKKYEYKNLHTIN